MTDDAVEKLHGDVAGDTDPHRSVARIRRCKLIFGRMFHPMLWPTDRDFWGKLWGWSPVCLYFGGLMLGKQPPMAGGNFRKNQLFAFWAQRPSMTQRPRRSEIVMVFGCSWFSGRPLSTMKNSGRPLSIMKSTSNDLLILDQFVSASVEWTMNGCLIFYAWRARLSCYQFAFVVCRGSAL